MDEALKQESEKLSRSWMQHDAAMLSDYLVAGVEDPRLNVQSVLSRHFLLRMLTGARFSALMEQELRFAAAMNWLATLTQNASSCEEFELILHALRHQADNVEGIEIPHFILGLFAGLPTSIDGLTVPNYIERILLEMCWRDAPFRPVEPCLEVFAELWRQALAGLPAGPDTRALPPVSVLEPACGSANDYRFLRTYGITRLVDYTGFDLCAKNVENARALFPDARFELGNVFALDAPDKSYELCFCHDLFEHLSLDGLAAAVRELCRVTRREICAGFFNLQEIPEHVVRPVDGYHWNTLSLARIKELFARHGFTTQVIHIGAFLRQQIGCEHTHNPNAYTLILRA
jgi:SAM-dependent methyltransferase